jgi:hypothetical protein
MDTQDRELWDRLENEPRRAFEAFQTFMRLPSGDRTLIAAYRQHVGNPEAVKPSDTWVGWSREFAWRERAAAYDDHIARVHRDAYERAIEEDAERQDRQVERLRYQFSEMMTRTYEMAIENLEESEYWSNMRPQDVINIVRLHLDSIVKLGEMMPQDGGVVESDWNEEHVAELDRILSEIEAEREEQPPPADDLDDGEEEDSEEGEEGSEESEGDPD